MSLSEEILKLQSLRESGVLTDAEFEAAKARVIGSVPPPVPPASPARSVPPLPEPPPYSPYTQDPVSSVPAFADSADENQWAMFLHLSMLAGLLAPVAGFIAPVVIWQIKKRDLPGLDVHGCNAVNWILSSLIYAIVSFILVFVFIGIPLLVVLAALSIIFPVIAAIRANEGVVWQYPLSITFFRPATASAP